MWKITIDTNKCEGEGDCVDYCPFAILSLEALDAKKVAVLSGQEDDCSGCMACTTVCPSGAIEVADI